MKMDASASKDPLPLWNFDPLPPLDDSPQAAEKTRLEFPDILDRDLTTRLVHRPIEHARRRIRQACVKCRSRKVKCSGERPSCTRCLARGVGCEYGKDSRTRGPKLHEAPTTSASEIRWRLSPYNVKVEEHEAIPRETPLLLPRLFLPSSFVDAPARTIDTMPSYSSRFPSQYTYSDGYANSDSMASSHASTSVSVSPSRNCRDSPAPPFPPPGLHGYTYANEQDQVDAGSPRDSDAIPIDPRLVTDEAGKLEHGAELGHSLHKGTAAGSLGSLAAERSDGTANSGGKSENSESATGSVDGEGA
ncbi:hypothetical protein C8R47DRAFT_1213776 [Mycena vitilis]|nr:hypothetical protein C8R47DRAFT_1213776 [Mycena vitilis]